MKRVIQRLALVAGALCGWAALALDVGTVEFEVDLDAASKVKLGEYGVRPGLLETVELLSTAGERVDEQTSRAAQVAPSGFNYGRGTAYATTRAVRAGSELFSVPMDQVMSPETAKRGRIGMLLDANPDLPPAIALALHLLEERFLGDRSNFSSFIEQLPSAINSSVFYSSHDLEQLRGAQVLRHILVRKEALDKFYEALRAPATTRAVDPPLFAEDQFTRENFFWAMGTIWSQAFPTGSQESDIVLAPILSTIGLCLDEREYACPANNIIIDNDKQQLVVYATTGYEAGQEVRMSAGSKSTVLLMLNHGISRARPSPSLDKLDVTIFLDTTDKLLSVKEFLVGSMFGGSVNDSYTLHHGLNELDAKMATSLKVKLLTSSEVARHMDLLSPPTDDTSGRRVVSLRNEFAFTRAVVTTCRNLLQQYATSLEHDQAKLAQLGEAANQTKAGHMLQALVVEKLILQHTIDLAMRDWSDLVLSNHPNLLEAVSV